MWSDSVMQLDSQVNPADDFWGDDLRRYKLPS